MGAMFAKGDNMKKPNAEPGYGPAYLEDCLHYLTMGCEDCLLFLTMDDGSHQCRATVASYDAGAFEDRRPCAVKERR